MGHSVQRLSSGLNGPGIESWWGRHIFAPVHTDREAHQASCTMGTGSFPGAKAAGACVDHPFLSSAEGKERLQLCLYSTCVLSRQVRG